MQAVMTALELEVYCSFRDAAKTAQVAIMLKHMIQTRENYTESMN